MSHEHELELASAAIDFELTPAERARLETAIAECPVCARAATAYRRQVTLFEALPVVDASPTVRRQVERAAGLRPQRTSWTWVLLAAALLGLLATSVLVAGAINQNRRNELADVSPTPSPTSPPDSSPAPEPSPDVIELDPPSGELASVGPPIAHESMGVVVTTNLRIRSAPFVGEASVKYRRLLQPDDRLFVIDGPVIGQNYEWYQVKAWRPRQPSISWPVGWVARAGHDGEVWLRAATASCPAAPIDIHDLVTLAPMERVACYRNEPVDVRAVVSASSTGGCDPAAAGCATGPAFLTEASLRAAASTTPNATAGSVPIAVGPAANVSADELAAAGVVRLRGAFDDAGAAACRPDPARAGPDGPLSPTDAVLVCRARFVVAHAETETFPPIVNGSGRTVSDRLRVRSLPEISDASIRYEPLLPLGTKVSVLEGPVLGSGYAWYRVTATITNARGQTVGRPISGWVAAAGLDGERWLEVRP